MGARLPDVEGRRADRPGRGGARRLHRRLPHRRHRPGPDFDYQFVDLGIAVVTIFFGRLGLQLARWPEWPAFALGTVVGAIGASPLKLPLTFLHWFG